MKPLKIYVGYDPRDDNAYRVLVKSIHAHASVPVDIIPVKDWEIRNAGIYRRPYHVDEKGQIWDTKTGTPCSTLFSFQRFAVPILEDYGDEWVLFIDADMMFRADVKELFDQADDQYAVMCVKHNYSPHESVKMDGVIQSKYSRKNWSSAMLMKPSKCRNITPYILNQQTGQFLHQFLWLAPDQVGDLPHDWNFLAAVDNPEGADPMNVHFTLGTPDMQGMNAPKTPWDDEWWAYLDGGGDRSEVAAE